MVGAAPKLRVFRRFCGALGGEHDASPPGRLLYSSTSPG